MRSNDRSFVRKGETKLLDARSKIQNAGCNSVSYCAPVIMSSTHSRVIYIYTRGGFVMFLGSFVMRCLNSVLVIGTDCLHPAGILQMTIMQADEKEHTCITLGARCCCSAKQSSTGG